MAVFAEGTTFPTGTAHAHFEAFCGPTRVRVVWDRDRSGKAGPPDLFCQGADEQGRLFVALSREARVVRCQASKLDMMPPSEMQH